MPVSGVDESTARVVATSQGRVSWIEAGPPPGASESTPPLVLIHGFTGHRDDFLGVLEPLARLGTGRRVIVPDLRGHGDSDTEPGALGWCFEQLVNDLTAFLDKLGLDRIDLLGHSMGGFVALRFALAHPERLRSLVFLCTGPEVPPALLKESFLKAAKIAGELGMAGLQAILEKVGRAESSPLIAARADDYWRHHVRRFDAMTPASYRGFGFALFDSPSLVKHLPEILQPTLVLVGEHDREWLHGADLFEEHLPDVHRETIPRAEHHPHNENPEAFLSAVERHLAALEAPESEPPESGAADPSRDIEQAEVSSMSVETEDIQITTSTGQTMGAYLARPEGRGPYPAVIVWMEIFGVNDHIRDVTRRFAAEGYLAIAPDFFHRTGPGIQLAYDESGFEEGFKHLNALEADQMIADAKDALAYLRSREDVRGEKIGVTGFCIGGHMTYLTACETDVVAAAAYYGGGIAAPQGPGGGPSTLTRTSGIRGRIVCYFGAKDTLIPQDQVDAIRQSLEAAGIDHEVHIYEDADHGFNCDQRGTYHAASAADAWDKTRALFASALR